MVAHKGHYLRLWRTADDPVGGVNDPRFERVPRQSMFAWSMKCLRPVVGTRSGADDLTSSAACVMRPDRGHQRAPGIWGWMFPIDRLGTAAPIVREDVCPEGFTGRSVPSCSGSRSSQDPFRERAFPDSENERAQIPAARRLVIGHPESAARWQDERCLTRH